MDDFELATMRGGELLQRVFIFDADGREGFVFGFAKLKGVGKREAVDALFESKEADLFDGVLEAVKWFADLQATTGHDADFVGDALDVAEDVRGEQNGFVFLAKQFEHFIEEIAAGDDIEIGGGFVEDEQVGALREREEKSDLAAGAEGKRADAFRGIDLETLEQAVAQREIPIRIKARGEFDEHVHAHEGVKDLALGDVTDPPAIGHGETLRFDAVDLDRAGVRPDEADEHLDGGGFAGAIAPEQAVDAAAADAQVQVLHDRRAVERAGDIGGFDDVVHRSGFFELLKFVMDEFDDFVFFQVQVLRLGDDLFDRLADERALFSGRMARAFAGNKCAEAAAGLGKALAFEQLIDLGDGEEIDLEFGGKVAGGRKFFILGELAAGDALAELLKELAVDRHPAVRIQVKKHSVV